MPFVIATIALILIQRRTRQRGEDVPLSAAIGTGVIPGFVTINVALVVVTAVTGHAPSDLTGVRSTERTTTRRCSTSG
ncbi:MAG TPA: hypothetical protein VFK35_08235 [Candidatus Limnocylindrales bacterium]|nr:hypothetical protein [Candidatus Limnocylindrales bacterium]